MAQPSPGKPQRVLLVDDDANNIALIRALMEAEGHEVASAQDGVEALEQAAAAPPPDLILLDVMMPKQDGYPVCRQLKQQREASRNLYLACPDSKGC